MAVVVRGLFAQVIASLWLVVPLGCDPPGGETADGGADTPEDASAPAVQSSAGASAASSADSVPSPTPPEPERDPHARTQDELLGLLPRYARKDEPWLRRAIDVGGFRAMNQGNPEIARHVVSRSACLAGLQGVTLQTPEQRRRCGGHENMVPIFENGDSASAKVCIDVFEFPNEACELPFVWAGPTQAQGMCKRLGKRLCTQAEWQLACAGDPAGGEKSTYAYGAELDLSICNTQKNRKDHDEGGCEARTIGKAWDTCATNTEPSGAFARCRSRFGVFDQHGNVAEAMTRYDAEDGRTVSQLKGSAFFYVDVHRKLSDKPEKETYPDHCHHDPRWHVEPMTRAWHVNYHLGFRCCVEVKEK